MSDGFLISNFIFLKFSCDLILFGQKFPFSKFISLGLGWLVFVEG